MKRKNEKEEHCTLVVISYSLIISPANLKNLVTYINHLPSFYVLKLAKETIRKELLTLNTTMNEKTSLRNQSKILHAKITITAYSFLEFLSVNLNSSVSKIPHTQCFTHKLCYRLTFIKSLCRHYNGLMNRKIE